MVRYTFVCLVVVSSAFAGCTSEVVTWEEPPESDNQSRPDDEDGEDLPDPDDEPDGGDDDQDGGRGRGDDEDGERDDEDDDDFGPGDLGEEVSGIPAGQMPPPGSCRIWYPSRPPGQQPPPGACAALRDDVPEDAWLLYRPTDEARVYRIG